MVSNVLVVMVLGFVSFGCSWFACARWGLDPDVNWCPQLVCFSFCNTLFFIKIGFIYIKKKLRRSKNMIIFIFLER